MAELTEKEKTIVDTTRRMIESSRSAMQTRESSVIGWRTVAENRAKHTGGVPFNGASRSSTPLTPTLAMTWAGQVAAPVLASVPMVMMEPDKDEEAEQVAALERLVHNTLVTCGFRQALVEWVKNGGVDGTSYLDIHWDKKRGRPCFQVLDSTDIGGFPAEAPRPEDEVVSYRRELVYPAELKRRISTKKYDADGVKEALATGGSPLSLAEEMKNSLDRVWPEAALTNEPIEVFHCLVRWDPSHADREAEPGEKMYEMVLTRQHTLIAPRPYTYKHGKPSWHALTPIPRIGNKEKFRYGLSVVELLAEQQLQHNAQRRQRFDLITLAMAAVTLVRKSAKFNIKDWFPGSIIETADPEKDARTISLRPDGSQKDPQEESLIREEARELIGLNQAAIGSASDTPLGVLQAAQAGTATRLDETMTQLEAACARVVDTVLALYEQYDPGAVLTPSAMDELSFIAGEQGPELAADIAYKMSKEALALRPRILLAAANKATNPIVRAQLAEKEYLFAKNSPIIQSDPELVYKSEAEYLRDMGSMAPERRLGSKEAWLERANKEPSPPVPTVSLSLRPDELAGVTLLKKMGLITNEDYLDTVELAATAAPLMPMRNPEMKPGEMADNAVGPPVDMPQEMIDGTVPIPEAMPVEPPMPEPLAPMLAEESPSLTIEEDPEADMMRMAEHAAGG